MAQRKLESIRILDELISRAKVILFSLNKIYNADFPQ
jgi:hypothetical protein